MRLCDVRFSTEGHGKDVPILMDHQSRQVFAQGFGDILEALKYKGFTLPIEKLFDTSQKVDSYCYLELVQSHLYKIQLFNWWAETKNTTFAKRITYSSFNMPFLPTKQDLMVEKLRLEGYSAPYKKKIYQESDRIYKSLSERLGSKDYYFGDEPSVLDCVVYAFLTTQFCADTVKQTLKQQIAKYENLKLFCKRMTYRVFQVETEEFDYVLENVETTETKEKGVGILSKLRSRISYAHLSSVVFVGSAGLLVGIYQFVVKYHQANVFRLFIQNQQQQQRKN
uniref:Metaxin glutathione S-transferase domain-containing protein n=1 Tax=Arcella intermedia TaxID=1963864 RepID=A0A6B2LBQ8_9EUKA